MHARKRQLLLCLTAVLAAGVMIVTRSPRSASADPTSTLKPYERYLTRAEATLAGTVRRFDASHAEFHLNAPDGAGRYVQIVGDALDRDMKPVYRSGGRLVGNAWTDSDGRWITPREYITARPTDVTGTYGGSEGGAAAGAASFSQLFRNVSGVNTWAAAPAVLSRSGSLYQWEGPVDGTPGPGACSTLELSAMLVHAAGAGWYFEVETDADVWGYVNDSLVIDGGAGASAARATVGDVRPLITVSETIELNNDCVLENASGVPVLIQTTTTRPRAVILGVGCRLVGDVLVGVGGSPDQVVIRAGAEVTGRIQPMDAAAVIPAYAAPSIGASVGDRTISDTQELSSDLHVRDLTIFSGGRLRVRGDVTIVCDGELRLSSDAHIDLEEGASLRCYVDDDVFISSGSTINNSVRNPRSVLLASNTKDRVTVNSRSGIYADIIAPRGMLLVNNDSWFAGSFAGRAAQLNNGAAVTDGSAVPATPSMAATYRIDLDRLAWLSDGATHQLRLFIADRDGTPSRVRVRTNITALNVAALPYVGGVD